MRPGIFPKIRGELQNDFFDYVLQAASNIGACGRSKNVATRRETNFAIKLRREDAAMVRAGSVVTAIERKHAAGSPVEHFPESGKKFRLAIFAEPLDLVFVTVRAKSSEFGDAGKEPT